MVFLRDKSALRYAVAWESGRRGDRQRRRAMAAGRQGPAGGNLEEVRDRHRGDALAPNRGPACYEKPEGKRRVLQTRIPADHRSDQCCQNKTDPEGGSKFTAIFRPLFRIPMEKRETKSAVSAESMWETTQAVGGQAGLEGPSGESEVVEIHQEAPPGWVNGGWVNGITGPSLRRLRALA